MAQPALVKTHIVPPLVLPFCIRVLQHAVDSTSEFDRHQDAKAGAGRAALRSGTRPASIDAVLPPPSVCGRFVWSKDKRDGPRRTLLAATRDTLGGKYLPDPLIPLLATMGGL